MGEQRPGWQADGSYVPCPECGYVPEPDSPGLGTIVRVLPRTPGTTIHKGNCLTCTLPPDVQRDLLDQLAEMNRVRRRGEGEARNFWIG